MEEQSRRAFSSNFQHFWFSPYKGHLNLVLCFAHAGSSIPSNKSRICFYLYSFFKDQMVQTDYNITGFMIHSCPIFLPRSKVFERTHKVSGWTKHLTSSVQTICWPTNQPTPAPGWHYQPVIFCLCSNNLRRSVHHYCTDSCNTLYVGTI